MIAAYIRQITSRYYNSLPGYSMETVRPVDTGQIFVITKYYVINRKCKLRKNGDRFTIRCHLIPSHFSPAMYGEQNTRCEETS